MRDGPARADGLRVDHVDHSVRDTAFGGLGGFWPALRAEQPNRVLTRRGSNPRGLRPRPGIDASLGDTTEVDHQRAATARSAAVVHPQVMVSATGGSYRFSASFPVHTYIVRGRTIVGYFTGFTAGTGYDNVITRTPVPLDAAIVFMRGCPAVDGSTSMTDRPPLPPGRYGLVAYVRGGGPQERQLLVSTPFPITVVR